jgi:BirA family biotin operon repressor/biotin-[acetyl-CoA-carboxylase] ligase
MAERTVTSVLLGLFRPRAGGAEMTMSGLLRETLAPLPDVQQALGVLRERKCLIEEEPSAGGAVVRLVSTGLACWRDVLEEVAKREKLRIGRRVMVFFRTGSTNDVAWQCAVNPEMDGLVVVADEQSAGRGRLGHGWTARAEQSVLMSVLLRGRGEGEAAAMDRLTLLAGLAAARGVEAACGGEVEVRIKWPNDLLVGGRKLAGILAERRGADVVIGVGVNVTQGAGDFGTELSGRATSVYQATGRMVDRLRVAAEVVRELDKLCGKAELPGDEAWLPEWKGRCDLLGQRVQARTGGGVIGGTVMDIDPLHGLVVRDESGAVHFLSAQTTSLSGEGGAG